MNQTGGIGAEMRFHAEMAQHQETRQPIPAGLLNA